LSYHIDIKKNKGTDTWNINMSLNETTRENVIKFLETKCVEILQRELQ